MLYWIQWFNYKTLVDGFPCSLFQSFTRVHRRDLVHLHKDNVVSNKQRVLFSSQPFWRSTTEIRCCLQPFKQNSELVLLDSIAAAVESQTIITCEQLRNIPKNIKEFVEGVKMTSCDENKNWITTRAARNLTLLPKQNLAKTTKNLTHTHHDEDWSTKDKGSNNKPPFHWVCARETKKTKPTNCTPSCKKVGLTLTKISSFQKRWQKKRK